MPGGNVQQVGLEDGAVVDCSTWLGVRGAVSGCAAPVQDLGSAIGGRRHLRTGCPAGTRALCLRGRRAARVGHGKGSAKRGPCENMGQAGPRSPLPAASATSVSMKPNILRPRPPRRAPRRPGPGLRAGRPAELQGEPADEGGRAERGGGSGGGRFAARRAERAQHTQRPVLSAVALSPLPGDGIARELIPFGGGGGDGGGDTAAVCLV